MNSIRSYIEIMLVVALAMMSLLVWHYRGAYQTAEAQLGQFKAEVKAAGVVAEQGRLAREAAWQSAVDKLEADHEKAETDNRVRFEREFARLRGRPTGAAGGAMPKADSLANCLGGAGSDRFPEPLRDFEIGLVRLLERCQAQTDTLIACQANLRAITSPSPP